MVVKFIVAYDYNEDIYVMVQGDRRFTSNLGVQGGIEIMGNGINFGLNKEVIWETAKTIGYTKIKSKCHTPFYPVADSDAVYVTIFCKGRIENYVVSIQWRKNTT
ncbi:Hypothetical predicted protein [Mytilus galloprovincialis]|uniref:Uncharacterized protein n=1 Tax=Mytilus galloprovincialis TaxID=29158 RepID=A0A8B6H6X7_MYTGA|nr:Hypothetical predicted protein [Mytilus galloprovincialis]